MVHYESRYHANGLRVATTCTICSPESWWFPPRCHKGKFESSSLQQSHHSCWSVECHKHKGRRMRLRNMLDPCRWPACSHSPTLQEVGEQNCTQISPILWVLYNSWRISMTQRTRTECPLRLLSVLKKNRCPMFLLIHAGVGPDDWHRPHLLCRCKGVQHPWQPPRLAQNYPRRRVGNCGRTSSPDEVAPSTKCGRMDGQRIANWYCTQHVVKVLDIVDKYLKV